MKAKEVQCYEVTVTFLLPVSFVMKDLFGYGDPLENASEDVKVKAAAENIASGVATIFADEDDNEIVAAADVVVTLR